MPLTAKGQKILANMKRQYGAKKGEQVFYASANKGTITGIHPKGYKGGRNRRKYVRHLKRKRRSKAA